MKAILSKKYGPPEILQVGEVPIPEIGDDEVLVKVRATSINDFDWSRVRGKPRIYRLMFGIGNPKSLIPGMELSGIVEKIGANITNFKTGDDVYGDLSNHGWGSFAEYVAAKEDSLIHKPEKMSFHEAASIPHASLLAYQSIFTLGKLEENEKVLVNGAGGGLGIFALQLLKLHGAKVTGVDASHKLDYMKQLGYDHVIDFKKTDFTKNGVKYDLIIDAKSTRNGHEYLRSLQKGGRYITVGGTIGKLIQIALLGGLYKFLFKKTIRVLPLKPNEGLDKINGLYEKGNIQCQVDGPYPFEDIPKCIQYFGEGKHQGKIVISVSD